MQVQSELRITRAFNVKWYNFKRLIAGSYKAEEYKRYLIDNFIKEIKWQVAKELSKTFEVYFHFKKSLLPSINIWETNLLEERENDSFLKSVGFDICSDYSVEYNSYLSWNNMVGQECNNSIDYICSTKKIPNYEEISKSRISINFGPYLVSSCLLWIEKGNLRKFNPKISKAVSKEKYRITKLLKLKIKIEASIYYEKRFLTEFTGATLGDVYKYFRHYNQANNHTITQLRFEELITRKETVEKMLNDLFSLFDTTIEYRNSQQNFKLQLWLVVITIISLFVSFISFTGYLNTCVSDMKKYDANYLKEITANGAVAIMADGKGTGSFTYNKYGLIDWCISPKYYNAVDAFGLEAAILEESFGIKMENLGGDYLKYEGFLKEGLASDCWWNLYKKNGVYTCRVFSNSAYLIAKYFYGDFYAPVTFKDKKIQKLLDNVRKGVVSVKSFGGPWPEIAVSLKGRPDWSPSDPV